MSASYSIFNKRKLKIRTIFMDSQQNLFFLHLINAIEYSGKAFRHKILHWIKYVILVEKSFMAHKRCGCIRQTNKMKLSFLFIANKKTKSKTKFLYLRWMCGMRHCFAEPSSFDLDASRREHGGCG